MLFKGLCDLPHLRMNMYILVQTSSSHFIVISSVKTICRAGGTPGWLWNLRPGSLDWTSHPDNPPDGSTLSRKPDRPVARATGSSSGSTAWTYPRSTRREGLRNTHSVTRHQPHQSRARNPPWSDATKPLQSRGDRDRTPIWMAVVVVGDAYPDRSPMNSGSHQ
jgi:hypothetical protein